MRLLFFGTYDAAAHPRVAVLRDGVQEHRHDGNDVQVRECNVPLGLSTAQRVGMLRNPLVLPLLAWRLIRCWASLVRCARRYRRTGSWPDAVVVGYLGHFDVLLARRLFPHATIVLDHLIGASDTATDRGVHGGVRQRLLRRIDAAALGAADLVVVDTDEHRDALPVSVRPRAVVVAVGAPPQWYAGPVQQPRTDGPLRVVFFGLFTPLQGTPTIGDALARLADDPVEVTMVGQGQDHEDARRRAAPNRNVRWLDWVAPPSLPVLVASHDVCLGIFGTGAKAARVVPNKVFQGAAAGCAVVTSDTAPQRRVLGDAALYVPPGDADALAEVLRLLVKDPQRLATARRASAALAARKFTAATVVTPLLDRLSAVAAAEVA